MSLTETEEDMRIEDHLMTEDMKTGETMMTGNTTPRDAAGAETNIMDHDTLMIIIMIMIPNVTVKIGGEGTIEYLHIKFLIFM